MSEIPADLRYTNSHEWVRQNDEGQLVIGITDHAQEALGEIVYVELPEADTELTAGDPCIVVESVKAASDVYSPVSGVVTSFNEALADTPELVNNDPYTDGWLMIIAPADADTLDGLLSADEYAKSLEDEQD